MTIKRINREVCGIGYFSGAPFYLSLNNPLLPLMQINDLKKEDMGDIRLGPSETSMLEWTGAIPGPAGSVYEGGLFEFSLTLPSDYP